MPRIGHLLLLAVLLCAPGVHANPPSFAELATAGGEPRQLGQGRMRWFGLALYDATLWVGGDHRHGGEPDDWRWDHPFALDLRYARDFKGRKLADASVDEIRRLGLADGAKLDAWRAHMVAAFPDVKKGERTLLSVRPERVEINPGSQSVDGLLKGRIAELIYLGDHIRARLQVAGHDDFIVKVPNKGGTSEVEEGREVKIGWRAEDCRALDYLEFQH